MSGDTIPAKLLGRPLAVFEYTNWRHETELRRVVPDRIVWLDDPGYGYKPGWFLIAWDLKKKAMRQFLFDPAVMRPAETALDGREPVSSHGVNILMVVR
jgi:hypothetical protein